MSQIKQFLINMQENEERLSQMTSVWGKIWDKATEIDPSIVNLEASGVDSVIILMERLSSEVNYLRGQLQMAQSEVVACLTKLSEVHCLVDDFMKS